MEQIVRQGDEHILVCLSSAPSNAHIVRTAAEMARAFGGMLTALHVQTDGRALREADQLRLQQNIRLAEDLGATIVTVTGEDIPYQIAEFSRLSHVSRVVLGRSGLRRSLSGRKPLTERLIEYAPDLNVYIIPDTQGENRGSRKPKISGALFDLPRPIQWLITLAALVGATGVGLIFVELHFNRSSTITVYLLGAVLVALFTRNYACSLVHAVGSVTLFNFFINKPRLSFKTYGPSASVTFAIMFVASLITATLANRLSEHARQSAEASARTKVLFETNQLLQKAADDATILDGTASQICKLLDRALVAYSVEGGVMGEGKQYAPPEGTEDFAGEREVAEAVCRQNKRAGAATDRYSDAQGQYLAIRSGDEVFGVIGICMDGGPLDPFAYSILLSILGECALALENRRNAREKEEAALLAQNEQLRADLLRAISHDLRTPLTSISGNAENLLTNDVGMDNETRRSLLTAISDDAGWLIQLVENLLSITRIGDGRARMNLSAQLVDEVIDEVMQLLERRCAAHHLHYTPSDELLIAQMDARLISQVLINLIDNAVKYTPEGSTIALSAERIGEMIAIRVADNGPGIPDAQKGRVFDLFYTCSAEASDCRRSLGLGLALCRSIVDAHGGSLTLADHHPQGAVFTFTIPVSEVILHV